MNTQDSGTLEGWLDKKTDWTGLWKKRLISFRSGVIAYKYSEDDDRVKKSVKVKFLKKDSADSLQFVVWTAEGDCWHLRCQSPYELSLWTSRIEKYLTGEERHGAQLENQRTSGGSPVPTLPVGHGALGGGESSSQEQQHGSPREGVFAGEADKRSDWIGDWRRRYFEFNGITVTYRVAKDQPAKATTTVIAVDRDVANDATIVLTTQQSVWFLRCDSRRIADQWLSRLRKAIFTAMQLCWEALKVDNSSLVPLTHFASACYGGHAILFGGIKFNPSAVSSSNAPPPVDVSVQDSVVNVLHGLDLAAPNHPCSDTSQRVLPHDENGLKMRPAVRFDSVMEIDGDTLHLIGGSDAFRTTPDHWVLDLASEELRWAQRRPLPAEFEPAGGRLTSALLPHARKILVVCSAGQRQTSTSTSSTHQRADLRSLCAVYDCRADEWHMLDSPPVERHHGIASCDASDDFVLYLGPVATAVKDPQTHRSDCDLLDANTFEWKTVPIEPSLAYNTMTAHALQAFGPQWYLLGGDSVLYSLTIIGNSVVSTALNVFGSVPRLLVPRQGARHHLMLFDDYMYLTGWCTDDKFLHRLLIAA